MDQLRQVVVGCRKNSFISTSAYSLFGEKSTVGWWLVCSESRLVADKPKRTGGDCQRMLGKLAAPDKKATGSDQSEGLLYRLTIVLNMMMLVKYQHVKATVSHMFVASVEAKGYFPQRF
jgi:hypothetical protein